MTASRRRFIQEFKDELCCEVISTSKPIKDVATAYGVGPETLRNWLVKYREANGGTEEDLTVSERARLKELEREVQELRSVTALPAAGLHPVGSEPEAVVIRRVNVRPRAWI
ncbi:transposase [Arthrobacter sp. UYEF3]